MVLLFEVYRVSEILVKSDSEPSWDDYRIDTLLIPEEDTKSPTLIFSQNTQFEVSIYRKIVILLLDHIFINDTKLYNSKGDCFYVEKMADFLVTQWRNLNGKNQTNSGFKELYGSHFLKVCYLTIFDFLHDSEWRTQKIKEYKIVTQFETHIQAKKLKDVCKHFAKSILDFGEILLLISYFC